MAHTQKAEVDPEQAWARDVREAVERWRVEDQFLDRDGGADRGDRQRHAAHAYRRKPDEHADRDRERDCEDRCPRERHTVDGQLRGRERGEAGKRVLRKGDLTDVAGEHDTRQRDDRGDDRNDDGQAPQLVQREQRHDPQDHEHQRRKERPAGYRRLREPTLHQRLAGRELRPADRDRHEDEHHREGLTQSPVRQPVREPRGAGLKGSEGTLGHADRESGGGRDGEAVEAT